MIGAIHKHAHAKGGPGTKGEYFCLWFAAIAVAALCQKLAQAMSAPTLARHVLVGFDDGDQLRVGVVSDHGFVPATYEPPRLPDFVPTDNAAPFYWVKNDTRGRWWLEEPKLEGGRELPSGFASRGRAVESKGPLVTAVMREPVGLPTDFTFAVLDTPIVSKRAHELLRGLVGADAQFIPVTVEARSEQFMVFNVLASHACLDMEKSLYRTFEVGKDRKTMILLQKAMLQAERAPQHGVFRLAEAPSCLLVSREVKAALERERISGITFEPVFVSSAPRQ